MYSYILVSHWHVLHTSKRYSDALAAYYTLVCTTVTLLVRAIHQYTLLGRTWCVLYASIHYCDVSTPVDTDLLIGGDISHYSNTRSPSSQVNYRGSGK